VKDLIVIGGCEIARVIVDIARADWNSRLGVKVNSKRPDG
jgi:hypothetical protein